MVDAKDMRPFMASSPIYGSDATQKLIAKQAKLVETLAPGSPAHRTATDLLLVLRDSLHVMQEARATLRAATVAREMSLLK